MVEKLGPSQEDPQRQPKPTGEPLLDFVASPQCKTLLEYGAPFAYTGIVFRAGHYIVNNEYLAQTLNGATTEEESQRYGSFYKGLGIVFIAAATALFFKHLKKSVKKDISRREFLIKAGGATIGCAGAVMSNLTDKPHNAYHNDR